MFTDGLNRLAEVGEMAIANPAWSSFGDYCRLRSQGLRPQSLEAIRRFLEDVRAWRFDARLTFVQWALEASRTVPDTLIFPAPLYESMILPTVREWAKREPTSAPARFWLGVLNDDDAREHFKAALRIDPACTEAVERLCVLLVGDISFNQHHLPHFYIHDPRLDLKALDEIEVLVRGRELSAWGLQTLSEARELREGAEAWLREHPREGDFADH